MDILKLFQYEEKLKFSDIEKALNVRSNKLTYHIKKLTKKGILKKEGKYYLLSETSERIIPFLSEKDSTLPAVLIHIGDSKECFLITRKKRPFKSLLSMPGGKILVGESIEDAVKRIMKEKYNLDTKLEKINSISLEQVITKQQKIIHSFLLIYVNAATKDKINLVNIEKNKKKIITSDYYLLKNDSNKKIDIKTINTIER
jgi:ADP-ribose pyrophosphatase YjhB (NUDIX family)